MAGMEGVRLLHKCCNTQVRWSSGVVIMFSGAQVARDAEAAKKGATARSATQPDDLIDFVQLKAKKGLSQIEIEDEVTTGG